MMRNEFSKATKLAAFKRARGRCELCTARLYPGHFDYHHDKECAFDGSNELSNCIVACDNCHGDVTKQRAPVIAKSNRVRNSHLGIKRAKRTIPGRKFDGTPIPARWRAD